MYFQCEVSPSIYLCFCLGVGIGVVPYFIRLPLLAKGAPIVGTFVQQPSSCGPNPQADTCFELLSFILFCYML